jgi:hypothetical protein
MVRTQVYLSTDELALLDQTERATGASRSELIRRAVQTVYGSGTADARANALQRGVGLWKARQTTGADYAAAARGDLETRLAALGLE